MIERKSERTEGVKMSLRKRVFLNVKINKGRSVGLFLVLSMILLFILVGLI